MILSQLMFHYLSATVIARKILFYYCRFKTFFTSLDHIFVRPPTRLPYWKRFIVLLCVFVVTLFNIKESDIHENIFSSHILWQNAETKCFSTDHKILIGSDTTTLNGFVFSPKHRFHGEIRLFQLILSFNFHKVCASPMCFTQKLV